MVGHEEEKLKYERRGASQLTNLPKAKRTYVSRSFWAGISCFAIAILSRAAISTMVQSIEERRDYEVRIAQIHLECDRFMTMLHAAIRGEGTGTYRQANAEAYRATQTLVSPEARADLSEFLDSYSKFHQAAVRQMNAVKAHDIDLAKRLETKTTQPAFVRLESAINDLDLRCRAEAHAWADMIKILSTVCSFAGAIAICVLFWRNQRRIFAIFSLEAGQRAAEAGERKFWSLVQNNQDVIAVCDVGGQLKLVSDASTRVWGRPPAEMQWRSILDICHDEDAPGLFRAIAEVATRGENLEIEIRVQHANGSFRPFNVQVSNLLRDPDVEGILLTCHDLTERKTLEEELAYHAFHDRLTGLPNRAYFTDRLSQRLLRLDSTIPQCAVLFIDLDNFKVINDSLGHAAGDSLLIGVAERLRRVLDSTEIVARLGGDEFTILLDEVTDSGEAVAVAESILRALEQPFAIEARQLYMTASIGIALSKSEPGLGDSDRGDLGHSDPESMLRDADTAMYEAKSSGRRNFAVFHGGMNRLAMERLELGSELRFAIEGQQLSLHYQPIVDLDTGKIREVEALLRWMHPTRGAVPPNTFVPLAEEIGFMGTLGDWAFRTACRDLRSWQARCPALGEVGMNVNVSVRQIEQPDFVDAIARTISDAGLSPKCVKIEITETAMLHDLVKMRLVFEQVRDLGVQIAIDDFGTGYSSISYLSHLPVDSLKIDRSFVSNLGTDLRTDGVVRAILTMSQSLGIHVISEGIETGTQLETLKGLRCDSGQGFLFAAAMPAEEMLTTLIRQYDPFLLSLVS